MLTYDKCVKLLGKRDMKKITGNTYLDRTKSNGDFHIVFYGTVIITVHSDGTYTLNTNRHRTEATKRRLNEYGPCRVWQHNHVWYAARTGNGIGDANAEYVPFVDGMRVDAMGRPVETGLIPAELAALARAARAGDEVARQAMADWQEEKGIWYPVGAEG